MADLSYQIWMNYASSANMINLGLAISEAVILYYAAVAGKEVVSRYRSLLMPLRFPPAPPIIGLNKPPCPSEISPIPLASISRLQLCSYLDPSNPSKKIPSFTDPTGRYDFHAVCKEVVIQQKDGKDRIIDIFPETFHIQYKDNPECKPTKLTSEQNRKLNVINVTY